MGVAAALGALLTFGGAAGAHEFRPGILDVTSAGGGRFEVVWAPAPGDDHVLPVLPERCVDLDPGKEGAPTSYGAPRAYFVRRAQSGQGRVLFDCGPSGLAGQRISALGMAPLRDEVLVRLHLEGGVEMSAMLRAERPFFDVPAPPSPDSAPLRQPVTTAILSYAFAGATHLVTGLDHMLFLLGLFLLVRRNADKGALARAAADGGESPDAARAAADGGRSPDAARAAAAGGRSPDAARAAADGGERPDAARAAADGGESPDAARAVRRRRAARRTKKARPLAIPLFLAITAFTVAHSLSLGLQVLGAVQLPPAPVEAAIALSVLLLARELVRPPGDVTLAQRRPHVVTFVFGLLHGLGFAGGLASLRVPRAEIPAALFGFNVGLEVAQLAWVLALMGVFQAGAMILHRLSPRSSDALSAHIAPSGPRLWSDRIPAYALGATAAYWLFTRAAVF